ncbi:infection structure specific protein [Colletotrichum sojae]|uniref:Infection structure specific protein n=1 Tax=Colletotrichum sojae TaxID=2175907 RepID=A0A8H6JM92_9PEZI|nr:infection structure specific protein [Colletotrichum sojae]
MHAKIALIAAVAGAAVATDIHPERVRRDILARQTDLPNMSADPCLSALATVYANAPTPPPKIMSYEMTAPPQTDACSITVPAELSAEYSSYTSQILSWVGANSASIESALSMCSTLTDMATEIPVCTSAIGGGSGGGGGGGSDSKPTEGSKEETAAGTGTAAGASKTGSPSKVSGNAGPRETAMMAAAAAAAGFVGVAAFL